MKQIKSSKILSPFPDRKTIGSKQKNKENENRKTKQNKKNKHTGNLKSETGDNISLFTSTYLMKL